MWQLRKKDRHYHVSAVFKKGGELGFVSMFLTVKGSHIDAAIYDKLQKHVDKEAPGQPVVILSINEIGE